MVRRRRHEALTEGEPLLRDPQPCVAARLHSLLQPTLHLADLVGEEVDGAKVAVEVVAVFLYQGHLAEPFPARTYACVAQKSLMNSVTNTFLNKL